MIPTPTEEQRNQHIQDTLAQEVLNQMLHDLGHEDGVWSIMQLLCDLGTNSAENYIFMRNYTESGNRHEREINAAKVLANLSNLHEPH